ncbi:MAG: extracellular solute-binding protein [Chloroflexi bacterium]|nr:extracellular solute-binding protein [Chloroflexota bacterium]
MRLGKRATIPLGLFRMGILSMLLILLWSCAPAAAPPTATPPLKTAPQPAAAPAPAAKATAAPAATTAAAPAEKAKPSALAGVIEGAKKEGKVSILVVSGLVGDPVKQIQEGIKKKYGVDLQIEATPNNSYPVDLAKAIAEQKAGTAPSADIVPLSDTSTMESGRSGVAEKIDWAPLIPEGTPKEVIHRDGYAIRVFTTHAGMMFNPKAIPPAEAPKSFADLANTKWQGKIAMFSYASMYNTYAYLRGVDKTLADLRGIMKNNPVVEVYARGETRYRAGEYPILLTQSPTYIAARNEGIPVEWVSLDVSYLQSHHLIVRKGAKNLNAAKLVAAFLAGPEGHDIYKKTGRGSMLYSGNAEFDIYQLDRKAGLRLFNAEQSLDVVEALISEKGRGVEKEISEILKG